MLAVVFVLTLPLAAIVIAVVNLFALVAYTKLFKGLPSVGNAVVGYLTGSTFLFGAAAVGELGGAVLVLFLLAALATVAREVVKDVEDIGGDCKEGLNTLPIVIGERRALLVALVVLALAIIASPLPYLRGTFGLAYLILVIPCDALMLYSTQRGFSDPTISQSYLKYSMYLAAIAFVAGRVSTLLS